jgi:hypothetical protein
VTAAHSRRLDATFRTFLVTIGPSRRLPVLSFQGRGHAGKSHRGRHLLALFAVRYRVDRARSRGASGQRHAVSILTSYRDGAGCVATYSAYAATIARPVAPHRWPQVVQTQVAPVASDSEVTVLSTVWHNGHAGDACASVWIGLGEAMYRLYMPVRPRAVQSSTDTAALTRQEREWRGVSTQSARYDGSPDRNSSACRSARMPPARFASRSEDRGCAAEAAGERTIPSRFTAGSTCRQRSIYRRTS